MADVVWRTYLAIIYHPTNHAIELFLGVQVFDRYVSSSSRNRLVDLDEQFRKRRGALCIAKAVVVGITPYFELPLTHSISWDAWSKQWSLK